MPSRAALALCLSAVSSISTGAEYGIECPAILADKSVQIVDAPAGWTPFTPSFLPLHGVGLMYGPPAEKTEAKPDSEKRGKNWESSTWRFDLPHETKWISCGYGAGNEVSLSKELPANTSMCKVTYTKKDQYATAKVTIRCESK